MATSQRENAFHGTRTVIDLADRKPSDVQRPISSPAFATTRRLEDRLRGAMLRSTKYPTAHNPQTNDTKTIEGSLALKCQASPGTAPSYCLNCQCYRSRSWCLPETAAASRGKPLAKRALPSAVASERLAVVMRRNLSGLKPRTRGVGRYLV